MKQFNFPESDVGIFFREPFASDSKWIREGTRVASGLMSLSGKGGKFFIDKVVSNLKQEYQQGILALQTGSVVPPQQQGAR